MIISFFVFAVVVLIVSQQFLFRGWCDLAIFPRGFLPFKIAPFGMGRVLLLSIFITLLLLRFFLDVNVGGVDKIYSRSDFCFIFVCFKFAGNSEPFFEKYISSRLNACFNMEFIYWSWDFICPLRNDTWSYKFLKDWRSSFVLKASLQVFFFDIERRTLFKIDLDFTES